MKLLLDEMSPLEIAVQLRRRGHDVVAVAERSDLRGQSDVGVFAVARDEERALLTENVIDYRPLAAFEFDKRRSHHGLLLTSDRRFPRHESRTVGGLISMVDELLSIDPDMLNREHWLV